VERDNNLDPAPNIAHDPISLHNGFVQTIGARSAWEMIMNFERYPIFPGAVSLAVAAAACDKKVGASASPSLASRCSSMPTRPGGGCHLGERARRAFGGCSRRSANSNAVGEKGTSLLRWHCEETQRVVERSSRAAPIPLGRR